MRVGCISESVEVDKGLIAAHQARLNDILNVFSKNIINVFTLNMMNMKCVKHYGTTQAEYVL